MYPFVETIRIMDGEAMLLDRHAERLNRTRLHFWPGCAPIAASCLVDGLTFGPGLHKLRVVYGEHGIEHREAAPYVVRPVRSLQLVVADDIDYTWKSTDRRALTRVRAMAPEADEVIIVRHGCVTDTSYTNLCFFDGTTWFTPDTPLLRGTMRQHLLDSGTIRERRILSTDLPQFRQVALINAMMPLSTLVLATACIAMGGEMRVASWR